MARKSRKHNTAQAAMPVSPFISTALYIRLSVEDNNKRGNSIETQKLVLEKFLFGKPELRLYTKAVVMARLEAEQEERQHQRQQMDISRMLTESDGLTSELVDLLIDKIYVYPDKRVDVEFKIRDSLAAHK